jgi:hypothetical protein
MTPQKETSAYYKMRALQAMRMSKDWALMKPYNTLMLTSAKQLNAIRIQHTTNEKNKK